MKRKMKTLSWLLALMVLFVSMFGTNSIFTMLVKALSPTYYEDGYSQFHVETSATGDAVYSAQTADMTYAFYNAFERKLGEIKNSGQDISAMTSLGDGVFSFESDGEYSPSSVYVYYPDWAPSCGLMSGVLNFKVAGEVKHVMLIAFRGTQAKELQTLVTDLLAFDEDGYHQGFSAAAKEHYNELKHTKYDMGDGSSVSFEAYLNKMCGDSDEYQMIVTGHSLGAAVANIFVSKIIDKYTYEGGNPAKNTVAYTYATPLTCNESIAKASSVYNVFNFINEYDWVPHVGYGVSDMYFVRPKLFSYATEVERLLMQDILHSNVGKGDREGVDLKFQAGDEGKKDLAAAFVQGDTFYNHHMNDGIYGAIRTHINKNIGSYYNHFVVYNNEDEASWQSVWYDNGMLTVSGNGTLKGDWSDYTIYNWGFVKQNSHWLAFSDDCTITEIGDYAFSGMSNLGSDIKLPDALVKIGDYAFYGCSFTGALELADGITYVGANAFNGCKFDRVNVAGSDIYIGPGAFDGCNQNGIHLPNQDSEATNASNLVNSYYYQNPEGNIIKVFVNNPNVDNYVAPGSTVYLNRIRDESLIAYPNLDYLFCIIDKGEQRQEILGVATITPEGVLQIDPDALPETDKPLDICVRAYYKNSETGKMGGIGEDFQYEINFTIKTEGIKEEEDGKTKNEFSGGYGTEELPYLISTAAQLELLANEKVSTNDQYFKLVNDIDFGRTPHTPIGQFEGVLDGDGYSIYNFSVSSTSDAGLIKENKGTVKNLIIGRENETTYDSLYSVKISVTRSNGDAGSGEDRYLYVGGIAAINSRTIQNCELVNTYVYGEVKRTDYGRIYSRVGGIAGHLVPVTDENGKEIIGGIITECAVTSSTIEAKALQDSNVDHHQNSYAYVGGIVGYAEVGGTTISASLVRDCTISSYAIARAHLLDKAGAESYAGGILGYCSADTKVQYCVVSETKKLEAKAEATGAKGTFREKCGGIIGERIGDSACNKNYFIGLNGFNGDDGVGGAGKGTGCESATDYNAFVNEKDFKSWIAYENGTISIARIGKIMVGKNPNSSNPFERGNPYKTHYFKGDEPNFSGLTIYGIKNSVDSSKEELQNYQVTFDPEKKSLTITWHGFTTTLEGVIEVEEVLAKDLKISNEAGDESPQIKVDINGTYSTAGFKVIAYFNDGSEKDVTGECKWDKAKISTSAVGIYSAEVSYGDLKDFFTVEVSCSHKSTELFGVMESTCVTYGYDGDTVCSTCGATIEEGNQLDFDPSNHTGEITTEDGGASYFWDCCKAEADVEHSYDGRVETIKPATCIAEGTKRVYCSVEGHTDYKDVEIPRDPKNHVGELEFKGQKDVHAEYSCCKKQVINHSMSYSIDRPATCIEEGTGRYSCECGYSYTETIAINSKNHAGHIVFGGTANIHKRYDCCNLVVETDHDMKEAETTDPTCTEAGRYVYRCECGYSYEVSKPALGHQWDAGRIKQAPTHLAEGIKEYTCENCRTTKTESLPKTTEHTWSAWTKEDEEQHIRRCECGEVQRGEHRWDEGQVTQEPSHTVEGTKEYTCQDCQATRTETLAKTTEHTWSAWTKKDENQHTRQCECGEVQTEGHHWDEGRVTQEATSSTEGTKEYTCKDCQSTKTEKIDVVHEADTTTTSKLSIIIVSSIAGVGAVVAVSWVVSALIKKRSKSKKQ